MNNYYHAPQHGTRNIVIMAACWWDTIPGSHLTSRKYNQGEEDTKEQMINIMVNKVQHSAILVMTYKNTGFSENIRVRLQKIYTLDILVALCSYPTAPIVLFFRHDHCQLKAQ